MTSQERSPLLPFYWIKPCELIIISTGAVGHTVSDHFHHSATLTKYPTIGAKIVNVSEAIPMINPVSSDEAPLSWACRHCKHLINKRRRMDLQTQMFICISST